MLYSCIGLLWIGLVGCAGLLLFGRFVCCMIGLLIVACCESFWLRYLIASAEFWFVVFCLLCGCCVVLIAILVHMFIGLFGFVFALGRVLLGSFLCGFCLLGLVCFIILGFDTRVTSMF